jgi:amino acid transporter
MLKTLRRLFLGSPISTEFASHEKLAPALALPVFASDAMSSVAYATGEIMAALLLVGTAQFYFTFPIACAIALLLVIVTTSYRQTVMAYPGGGGAYIVSRDNLGLLAAQIAGSALMIDYVLTVAVSISAGAAAIRSLTLTMLPHDVQWSIASHTITLLPRNLNVVTFSLLALFIITWLNLRGVRENGKVIAPPVYAFIGVMFALIGFGLWRLSPLGGGMLPMAHPAEAFAKAIPKDMHGNPVSTMNAALYGLPLVWLLLQSFASGCAALTGVEAISNGVTAFKQPASRNAAKTMLYMSAILGIMFLGVSYLAVHVRALPETAYGNEQTVISQIGRSVFGQSQLGNVLYSALQILTALILVLGANTAFADFPRLSALVAKDGFLPRQLANVGDRLVFDRGIITIAILAGSLIWWKHGSVHQLIPLYAVGVFLSFTMSQSGMVRRWLRLRTPGWEWKAVVNGTGAVITAIVTSVILIVKFTHGAWLVAVLIPLLVLLFLRIHAHYQHVTRETALSPDGAVDTSVPKHAVLVMVPVIGRGVEKAVRYARSLAGDVRGIHIETDPERTPAIRDMWMQNFPDVTLVILPAPFRSVVEPLNRYLDEVQRETPNTEITAVIPEFVASKWWHGLLHNRTGFLLKQNLSRRPNLVITNVRYHLPEEEISLQDLWDMEPTYAHHEQADDGHDHAPHK